MSKTGFALGFCVWLQLAGTAAAGGGQSSEPRPLPEDFKSEFRCPESRANEPEAKAALDRFFASVVAKHPDWTIEDAMRYRMELLVYHDCTRTLDNLPKNFSKD